MDWFTAGAQVAEGTVTTALYPPLDNRDAQRWWLGGFGAAWVERLDDTPLETALATALQGHPALYRQLCTHGHPTRTLQ